MATPVLMFQGTGTDAGKTLIVAGVVRALTNRGLKVRPFKSQNMGSQTIEASDGGEVSKAQAIQALAARVPLSVHMNPVLLKPYDEVGAHIIVQGKREGTVMAADYQNLRALFMERVLESLETLKQQADIVIVEGAGSPAEVNLRNNDIANMGFAEDAKVPVVLIGDIDRGGVIASLVGTKVVLEPSDAAHIKGFLINKFRGDANLFTDGIRYIEKHTGWPFYGLIPFFQDAKSLKEPTDERAAWRISDVSGTPVDTLLDAFAAHLEKHLDINGLLKLAAENT